MGLTITKTFGFSYGHHLPLHKGKCAEAHGHNAVLEVTISGEVGEDGMIMDFGDLKQIVNEKVVNVMDHSYLNDWFHTQNTTAENIVSWIRDQLPFACRLRFHETPGSFAEWCR